MTRRLSLPAIMTAVLVAATVALSEHVYTLWQHLDDPVEVEPGAGAVENAPAPLVTGAAEAPPMAAFSAVTERPLFTPTRRPLQSTPELAEETGPEAVPPAMPEPIEFSLVGIAVSQEGRVALVRRQADGKVFRVVEGGEVLGWTASSIEPQRAIFRRDDQEEMLVLEFGAGPTGSPEIEPFPSSEPETGGEQAAPPPAPDQGG